MQSYKKNSYDDDDDSVPYVNEEDEMKVGGRTIKKLKRQ